MKYLICLPFFPGYYESCLYDSDSDYYSALEELDNFKDMTGREDLTIDDIKLDLKGYMEDTSRVFTDEFFMHSPSGLIESAEYVRTNSPQYYNYSTDDVVAEIELAPNWKQMVKNWVSDNFLWFEERLKDDWSSRDGFISFIENEPQEFLYELYENENPKYIEIIIGYMMFRNDPEIKCHLAEDVLDRVSLSSYYSLKERK